MEVLRARVPDDDARGGGLLSSGRNPRALRLSRVLVQGHDIPLDLVVHDRWAIPRELLVEERPADFLPDAERRLVAEWLAKRYIRAAFPTAFDYRWRAKSKAWQRLLKRYSRWIQGVYLRLHTLRELPNDRHTSAICSWRYPKTQCARVSGSKPERRWKTRSRSSGANSGLPSSAKALKRSRPTVLRLPTSNATSALMQTG